MVSYLNTIYHAFKLNELVFIFFERFFHTCLKLLIKYYRTVHN